jgi:nicotinate phosphoribosyltransferase
MSVITDLYGRSLALLTDLYQLTMAYGYWKLGMAQTPSVFQLAYRRQPFNGGFAIACGLDQVIDYLQALRFDGADLDYLASIVGNDGKPCRALSSLMPKDSSQPQRRRDR